MEGRSMHAGEEGILGLHQCLIVRKLSRINCEASLHHHSGRCGGEVLIMDVIRPSARFTERVLAQAKDTLRESVHRTAIHGRGSSNGHR